MQDTAADVLQVSRWYALHSEQFQTLKCRQRRGKAIVDAPSLARASKHDVLLALSSTNFWIFCINQWFILSVFSIMSSNQVCCSGYRYIFCTVVGCHYLIIIIIIIPEVCKICRSPWISPFSAYRPGDFGFNEVLHGLILFRLKSQNQHCLWRYSWIFLPISVHRNHHPMV